jgi:hypothetical protein
MFNTLPEFVEKEGQFTYFDFHLDDEEISGDPNWMRKIRYRVGAVAVEFNALEAEIDYSILDWMNIRAEDDRLWVFLELMAASKKIHSLFEIYARTFHHCDVAQVTIDAATDLKHRLIGANVKRNFYVHANWHNTINEHVEHRTRRIPSGVCGRVRRKITIAEIDSDIETLTQLRHELAEFHDKTAQAVLG